MDIGLHLSASLKNSFFAYSISNACCIALARSAKDDRLRYLKQVKVRTGEYRYDSDNVIILDIAKTDGCLRFEIQGYANEYDHLRTRDAAADDYDEIIEILRLQRDGKSVREIASALDMSSTTVFRRLKKAKEKNITIPADTSGPVPSVPPIPLAERPERPEHPEHPEQRLPFSEEDRV